MHAWRIVIDIVIGWTLVVLLVVAAAFGLRLYLRRADARRRASRGQGHHHSHIDLSKPR